MPEDRNQAIKKQLLKKRDDAARRKIPLAPGEMVDDALARGSAGAGRWIKAHSGALQWALLVLVALAIAYGIYDRRMARRAEEASSELMKAVVAEHGRIAGARNASSPEDDPGDDPTPTFKSVDERREAALAAYRKVSGSYGATGAGILARLGEAGLLLDKRDFDGALAAYRDVRSSKLAAADVSVRGRAVEGTGLALEGKGDLDGALKAFREVENTDARGLKELGMYQQARILFGKGELEPAKTQLVAARERLTSATTASPSDPRPFGFLESQVDDLLRRIDPSAIKPAPERAASPDQGMTPERLQALQQQMQRQIADQQRRKSQGQGSAPAPAGSP